MIHGIIFCIISYAHILCHLSLWLNYDFPEDIDDRDSVFMEQMAARGYVAVTVDYADSTLGYTSGCTGFNDKSSKIFNESNTGTVLHQLCRDTNNLFNHGPNVPVDCDMGVAVNGWSQGAHIAALGASNSPGGLVTGGKS